MLVVRNWLSRFEAAAYPILQKMNAWEVFKGNSGAKNAALVVGGSLGILYLLFLRKLLPRPIALYFGRMWHFTSLPFLVVAQELGLRGNLLDKIDDHVYLGGIIMPYQVPILKAMGIQAVVNLCDEYRGPTKEYAKHNIDQLNLPTIDHLEPSFEDLKRAVAFIDDHVKRGHNVLIHCRAGRGRSAAVAVCWLAHCAKDHDLRELQKTLLSKRSKVRKVLYCQPNIMRYSDYLRTRDVSM